MYMMVSLTIAAAGGIPLIPDDLVGSRNAYAVPRIHTTAVTAAVMRLLHHGVSG
jgi:hypothetical protein